MDKVQVSVDLINWTATTIGDWKRKWQTLRHHQFVTTGKSTSPRRVYNFDYPGLSVSSV